MENRPITAFILTFVGGLFVIMGTVLGLVLQPPYVAGGALPYYYYPFLFTTGVCGVILLAASALMHYRPELHVAWGIVALVVSVMASVGAVTGYYALLGLGGMVFGLIGGAMAVGWRTTAWGAVGHGVPPARICPNCGRYVPSMYPYCIYCGAPSPVFQPSAAGPGQRPPTGPP